MKPKPLEFPEEEGLEERELVQLFEQLPDGIGEWQALSSGLIVPKHLAQRMTAVDLYCGCGGFSLGVLQAGFDVLAGCDNDPMCLATYLTNLGAYPVQIEYVEEGDKDRLESALQKLMKRGADGPRARGKKRIVEPMLSGSNRDPAWGPPGWQGVPVFWFGDIAKLSGARLLKSIGLEVGELDLLVGGPPCQGYSYAGKRNIADPRNNGVFEFARLVCEMQPKTIAMENVPGIANMNTEMGVPVLDEFCRILQSGSFGEFDALRRALAGDARMVRNSAREITTDERKRWKREQLEREAQQRAAEDTPTLRERIARKRYRAGKRRRR